MQSHSHYKMPCVTPSLAEEDAPQTLLMQGRETLPRRAFVCPQLLSYHTTLWLLLQLQEACMGQHCQRSFCFV